MEWVETSESRSASLSRRGKRADSTVTRVFHAFGAEDDLEVHDYVNGYLTSNQYYYIDDYQFMVETYELEHLGDQAYKVTVKYVRYGTDNEEQNDPLRRTRSFDTGGGTTHITQALAETAYSSSESSPAPTQRKAIGVDGDRVNGVDIVIPALQWTEAYDVPSTYITAAYIRSLAGLTGCTNNAEFRGFERGEVLFLGATGNQAWDEQRGDGPWNISYKFQASKNSTDLSVGSIMGIEKRGHEYLWVRYESKVESNVLLKVPKHAYVNQVYKEASFSALGIGS
jgi:hypothetical protein